MENDRIAKSIDSNGVQNYRAGERQTTTGEQQTAASSGSKGKKNRIQRETANFVVSSRIPAKEAGTQSADPTIEGVYGALL